MAARRPRQNPQPPNRTRGRATMPSVASLRTGGLSFERSVLGASPKGMGSASAAAARARMNDDDYSREAFEAARDGDTSVLLPYQPTPSINPPRPRTLAAGYDSNNKIMRIEYRDGGTYEYYNVLPNVWRNFKRVKSPGRFVDRVLKAQGYEYSKLDI